MSRLRAIGDILWNALKRRQAMQALLAARESARESEERFRLIANTAPVMIWMSDVDKQVTYVNQPWLDFTGWPANVTPGHRWIRLIHPDDVERCRDVYVKAFDQRKPFDVEHRLRRHDGEYRWTVTVGVPRYGTDRSFDGYVGTAVDVTDRKLVELALRDSHAALRERTVELERRTAQLSQMASDLTLAEQTCARRARQDAPRRSPAVARQRGDEPRSPRDGGSAARGRSGRPLTRAKGHLDEAIAAARSLSLELFPPVLHGSGLPAALTWLAERTRNQYGLLVQVSADPLANSDRKDVRTLLFESVRELLFNAVKHAQVDRVTIDLSLDRDDALCIIVADRGIGFDPAGLVERAKSSQAGWGLFSIRERLTLLGGRFDIESAPGRGTLFRLVAPRGVRAGAIDATSPSSRADRTAGSPRPRLRSAAGAQDSDGRRSRRGAQSLPRVVAEAARASRRGRSRRWTRGDRRSARAPARCHPDGCLDAEMDGVEATRRIRAELPFIQILGLSMYHRKRRIPTRSSWPGPPAFSPKASIRSA